MSSDKNNLPIEEYNSIINDAPFMLQHDFNNVLNKFKEAGKDPTNLIGQRNIFAFNKSDLREYARPVNYIMTALDEDEVLKDIKKLRAARLISKMRVPDFYEKRKILPLCLVGSQENLVRYTAWYIYKTYSQRKASIFVDCWDYKDLGNKLVDKDIKGLSNAPESFTVVERGNSGNLSPKQELLYIENVIQPMSCRTSPTVLQLSRDSYNVMAPYTEAYYSFLNIFDVDNWTYIHEVGRKEPPSNNTKKCTIE